MSVVQEFPGSGRYELVRRLGAGGMGVVFEAVDRETKVTVALKTLRFRDAAALYRFKNEFRALAGVIHPNLVALHELVAADHTLFFTMELVGGADFLTFVNGAPSNLQLASTISSSPSVGVPSSAVEVGESRLPSGLGADRFDRLRHALRQLAAGVGALHSAGKLHRDLKPSNVMVTAEGRVVVLDFGLVMELGDSRETEHGGVSGTVEYMAPE